MDAFSFGKHAAFQRWLRFFAVFVSAATAAIASPSPSLSIATTHTGNFLQGQLGAAYTITVTNTAGAGTTSGTVTVTDSVPPGMTLVSMSGMGWTCVTATANCTRSDMLLGGVSYPPILVTVNVAANTATPLVNVATVWGGGSSLASAMDSTVIQTPPPAGILFTTGNASAYPGQSVEVPIRLNNLGGQSPSVFQVDVSFDQQKLTFVSARKGEVLANSSKDVSTLLLPNSDERLLTTGGNQTTIPNGNTIYLTFQLKSQFTLGLAAVTLRNCQASDSRAVPMVTTCGGGIVSVASYNSPALSISSSHTGNFTQGQAGAFNIVVSNSASAGPSVDMVTVNEILPAWLTLVSMSGAGWQCPGTTPNRCSRNDTLSAGHSYPPITVVVTVGSAASTPQVNTVCVSGGGGANANATDPVTILVPPAGLSLLANVTLGPGDFVAFPVTLATPASDGGVFVTLTSSNPAAVTVRPSNVFIPAGQSLSMQPKLTGVDVGSAIITASASNYQSTSQLVVVAPNRTLSFSPQSLSIAGNALQTLTLNLLGGNAPDGGLVVSLSSSDVGVATVPPTVIFPPGTNTMQLRINPVGPGSAVIHAGVWPNIAQTSAGVSVQRQ